MLLREPTPQDLGPLVDLLSLGDAMRFGLDEPVSVASVQELIERFARERASGVALTYVITLAAARTIVGLVQVRQLDPSFEAAEWECTIAPSSRGTGFFLDTARLIGSFAFGVIGTHRLEARVLLQNGRANGALRKLGAVQEGVLRRSVRRGGEYCDQVLWSLLKEDWGDHWVSTRRAGPLMRELPLGARLYVGAVIVIGVTLMAVRLPDATFAQPVLFFALLILSSVTAALKVHLPLTTSGSTMSVSYAVDFASLLLLGPHETMLVAAGSAFSQCHLNSKDRNPIHRTLFSMASLVITVQARAYAFHLLGGSGAAMTISALARPLVGAATVYFLLNTGLVATRDRAARRARRSSAPGTTTSCGARRAISSAPAARRSPPGSSPTPATGSRRSPSRRST